MRITRKLKYILCLVLNLFSMDGFAEEFISFSIVDLSIMSDQIVEANFIKEVDGDYYFLIKDLIQGNQVQDTLVVEKMSRLYNIEVRYRYKETVSVKNAEKIIIYLSYDEKGNKRPTWSGFRFLKNNKIYLPYQLNNPGNFSFIESDDSISWTSLEERIIAVDKRVREVKAWKEFRDLHLKNERLMQWLEQEGASFGKDCRLNEDCGWGFLEWQVFDWITESNIAEDTWEASQLLRRINAKSSSEWRRGNEILRDENGCSFNTYDEIEFLIKTALDSVASVAERSQALEFFTQACNKVYEKNYRNPDPARLQFQRQKQKAWRAALLPLLKEKNFRERAFRIIKRLSNPRDASLRHRIDLEIMPLIIEQYLSEAPSGHKNTLAEFIVYNSTKAKWKELTNNDEKIFVSFSRLRMDTLRQELSFSINYNNGKEAIATPPKIVIESLTDKNFTRSIEYTKLKLPYNRWQGSRSLKTKIEKLNPGKYKVYLTGRAGENGQFIWKSEYAVLEME